MPATVPRRPASAAFGGGLLVAALASFVGGSALQLQQPVLWETSVYACFMALAGAIACFAAIRKIVHGARWGLVLSAALLAGFALVGLRAVVFQSQALNPALEGRDLLLRGTVATMPQQNEAGMRFRFDVDAATLDGAAVRLPPRLYLGWYGGVWQTQAAGSAQVLAEPQQQPPEIRPGDRWQFNARLKAPHGSANPHGFDYELWMWEQGLQANGTVRAGPKDPTPQRLGAGTPHPVERARQQVRDAIFASVADRKLAGVVAALVTGDQNAIDRADWDIYRATGVAHLMSISGLHITMFAWLAATALGWLWRRSPWLCRLWPAPSAALLGGLLLAAGYALFSGWGVPAQRTVLMLATVGLLRLGGVRWPWPVVCLLAMAVVVAADPWALLQTGFWLSFVAVAVLFASDSGKTGGRRAQRKPAPEHPPGSAAEAAASVGNLDDSNLIADNQVGTPASSRFLSIFREQWVVTLALTPLTLLLFGQVSGVGLLANLLAIPWVTLVVTPLAMLGMLYAPLWTGAAGAVGLLGGYLQVLAALPFATLSVPAPALWAGAAGVLGGLLLVLRLPRPVRVLGLPLLLPVVLWQAARPAPGSFELLAADVGQGNAVLVRTAGHSLLYDAGPRFSSESDAGNRVLLPLLRAFDEKLDTVLLSHRDTDHIGGAPAVLAMQPQAALLSSIESSHPLQALRSATRCVAGQRWRWDGVDFEILHPQAADYDGSAKSNALSCVLRIAGGGKVALLVGDIEAAQEARLVASGAPLKADFLLVPHHGSKTSSTAGFLDAVQPQLAVAQTGYRNRFGHPAPEVQARYRERGVALVESPQCGALGWRSDSVGVPQCQRQVAKRYWQHRWP
ncbi:MAG: DNA internalization-related competence protein ComEC/Rec2 [Pseudomonadota bacterium]